MIHKLFCLWVLCVWVTHVHAQNAQAPEWISYARDEISIHYPNTWRLDTSGQVGTRFILYAPADESGDQFQENINLLKQNLGGQELSLQAFTELSEKQIRAVIANSAIQSIDLKQQGALAYSDIQYTGDLYGRNLAFRQFYFITNGQAYVLTFTAEQHRMQAYAQVAKSVLSSFRIAQ